MICSKIEATDELSSVHMREALHAAIEDGRLKDETADAADTALRTWLLQARKLSPRGLRGMPQPKFAKTKLKAILSRTFLDLKKTLNKMEIWEKTRRKRRSCLIAGGFAHV